MSNSSPMKIVISGATGFVGTALVKHFREGGNQVTRLVRTRSEADDDLFWDPYAGELDRARLEGVDAVIHLCGRNIVGGLWTARMKRELVESRTLTTAFLARELAALKQPPPVFLSASGIGYYGNRGDDVLTEESALGTGFVAELCAAWEAAPAPAQEAGVRVVNLRFGLVLDAGGGLLQRMVTPFRFGVGGRLGHGRQYMSWVDLHDVMGIVDFIIANPEIAGPVNIVTPYPVDNREFTRTLGAVLRRWTPLPVPGFILRCLPGGMGDELMLASCRAVPKRLLDAGFSFEYPELNVALRHALGE